MFVKTEFWYGVAVGAVTGVLGYRLYEQYGDQLKGLVLPACAPVIQAVKGGAEPTLEELVAQKERLEDLIAEKRP
ncbi:MAG: 50S ribosomal protein L9 [Dethiobacter sp.]|nr:50S ribosomal protein L9 [Dethiobacter sp.]